MRATSAFYAGIDDAVRWACGSDGYDYWTIDHEGKVFVRITRDAESVTLAFTFGGNPRSYPDAITNPLDPPTVDGTDVTRPI